MGSHAGCGEWVRFTGNHLWDMFLVGWLPRFDLRFQGHPATRWKVMGGSRAWVTYTH